jgi:glycosyltransferase involved in cell wall biosynthesis
LIVSDNASPDHTPEAVKRFNDPRIRYVRHPENVGLVANWANCTDIAKGEWLVFNQDDDLLSPYFLERCSLAIRKHPEIVMYATECTASPDRRTLWGTGIINFCLHHRWDKPQPLLIPGVQIAVLNLFQTGFFPPAQAFPTHLIRRLFPRGEDAEMLGDRYITWRIACEGTVAFEAYLGALLCWDGTNWSIENAERCSRSPAVNAAALLAHFEQNGIDWKSALRAMVPEMRREYREWLFDQSILNGAIPAAAFEMLAEDLAADKGVTPAEWVAARRVAKVQSLAPPAPAEPPSPAPLSRSGRLDRLGLPRPVKRFLRKMLSLVGKKY